ncbi:MAG: DNA-directed RNA polymerase subunit G [Fervidicoccaceae archaeon]
MIMALRVRGLETSAIPKVKVLACDGSSGEDVLVEFHEEFGLSYEIGEELELELTYSRPELKERKDYCGRAFLYSIKEKENKKVYLFSIGGFILRIASPRELADLEVAKEYYFCLRRARRAV